MNGLKLFPIGLQDFARIRRDGYYYVGGSGLFIPRPRPPYSSTSPSVQMTDLAGATSFQSSLFTTAAHCDFVPP